MLCIDFLYGINIFSLKAFGIGRYRTFSAREDRQKFGYPNKESVNRSFRPKTSISCSRSFAFFSSPPE